MVQVLTFYMLVDSKTHILYFSLAKLTFSILKRDFSSRINKLDLKISFTLLYALKSNNYLKKN